MEINNYNILSLLGQGGIEGCNTPGKLDHRLS